VRVGMEQAVWRRYHPAHDPGPRSPPPRGPRPPAGLVRHDGGSGRGGRPRPRRPAL
jgi:hypothetical protein